MDIEVSVVQLAIRTSAVLKNHSCNDIYISARIIETMDIVEAK